MKIKDDKEMLNACVEIIEYLYKTEHETELEVEMHVDEILDIKFGYTMHAEITEKLNNPGRD